MASVQALALPVLLVLVLAVRSGKGVKCWTCSSDVDHRCGNPFNMTHLALVDCDSTRTLSPLLRSISGCKKIMQRVNNELITARSCTWETDDSEMGPCSSISVSSYAKVEYCSTCSHDACNAAETLSNTLFGLAPLLLALLVSRHFNTN